jgi:hypothetical protein
MSYTGLTVDSTTNGVDFIASAKVGLNASIAGEILHITGDDARLNGSINITRSQISVSNPLGGDSNNRGQTSAIAYTNSNNVTDTSNIAALNQSSLSFDSDSNATSRLLLSQIIDSTITETGFINNLIVYTQPNAILANSQIISINWLELAGSVSQFSGISLIGTAAGVLNYEAGNIDLIGINIPSTTSGYSSALGEGNGGNNTFVFWNPVALDFTKLMLLADNNRGSKGYTISWIFQDAISTVSNALIIYRDDRNNIGGSKVELGRYLTNSSGILTGTYDSKQGATGSNIDRPTLWIRTSQTRTLGTTALQNPPVIPTSFTINGQFALKEYAIDSISAEIEIRSYLHLAPDTVSAPTTEVGRINPNESVNFYRPFVMQADEGITQTSTTTLALLRRCSCQQIVSACREPLA